MDGPFLRRFPSQSEPRQSSSSPYVHPFRRKLYFYTNSILFLRVAACLPFGKTSCFSQNGRAASIWDLYYSLDQSSDCITNPKNREVLHGV